MKHYCDFCVDVKLFEDSNLRKVYDIESRIVLETEHFIVTPTIGQLIDYSYLIIPKKHYERFADLGENILNDYKKIVSMLESKVDSKYILFEHGALRETNSACGIYHAHIHFVPINKDISPSAILGENFHYIDSISLLKETVGSSSNYLLYQNNSGCLYISKLEESKAPDKARYTSQYFRKWLVKEFNLNKSWNWHDYEHIKEIAFLNALYI